MPKHKLIAVFTHEEGDKRTPPGEEFEVKTKAEAEALIAAGRATPVSKATREQAKAEEPITTGDLPADFPGREALVAAGLKTLEDVRRTENLTQVEGIGEATEKQIRAVLEEGE